MFCPSVSSRFVYELVIVFLTSLFTLVKQPMQDRNIHGTSAVWCGNI